MSDLSVKTDPLRQLRVYSLVGVVAVVGLFGGLITWAAVTDISGATIATGAVAVDGNIKRVQHPTGGVVEAILVEDGEKVRAGDVLVRLDSTRTEAVLASLAEEIDVVRVRITRLEAEVAGASSFTVPADLSANPASPSVVEATQTELVIFQSSLSAQADSIAQISAQKAQLRSQITSFQSQSSSASTRLVLVREQIAALSALAPSTALDNEIRELKKQEAALTSDRQVATSGAAGAQSAIAERDAQVGAVDLSRKMQSADQLETARGDLRALTAEQAELLTTIDEAELKAPVTGIVHESAVHTVGGVIGAGETIMLVVPDDGVLVIDARISPADIDTVELSGPVLIRLSALNQRTTPELWGTIRSISPDLVTNPTTGEQYYALSISISASEREKLVDVSLVPGMPVEAFVQTGDRTVLSYLLRPLLDQFNRAFREE